MARIIVVLCACVAVCAWSTTVFAFPQGSCCLPDGTCLDGEWSSSCGVLGGVFYPEQTCADIPCGEPEATCRITGGGVDCDGGVFVPGECTGAVGKMHREDGINTSTFGGQVGASNSEYGEWTHVNHTGPAGSWAFHGGTASAPDGTFMRIIACPDPEACNPAAANGHNKQIDIEGVGVFRNGTPPSGVEIGALCDVTIHIEDLGEPGRGRHGRQPNGNGCLDGGHAGLLVDDYDDCGCPDFYEIQISCDVGGASEVVYVHSGYLTAGNLQMHDALD